MMATALIVEDHPDQARLVAQLLRLRGYVPILAETGEAGLRLARQHSPDIVLLDLMLPDISGFEVCRRLRTDRATMLMPIVMLTALGDADNRRHGFRVGANAYVTKPWKMMDEIFDAIVTARAWRAEMERGQLNGEIHVELNSEFTLLQDLNGFLMTLCQSTPFSNEQVMQLRQAVLEMVQNAIEWGNKHQSDHLVNITYRVYEDQVEIIIRDQGKGFDRSNLPHAAAADALSHLDVRDKLGLRAGGFGLMICQGMVDEMRYNDIGNEVTLIKRFSPG
jgi:DNA-binding response OmpR family regulator